MRRLAWLLALPYVVMSGTTSSTAWMVSNWDAKKDVRISCGNDEGTCEDLAEALNEAHKRRTNPSVEVFIKDRLQDKQ